MRRSSKNGETSLARYDIIVKTFWGLPSCFLVWIENFSSQHQTSTTFSELVREDGSTLLLPRSPARFLTSTPKPRAEERWPPVALCRAGLGSRLGRCWALPTGKQHPRRQARQVLLPLPKNRRKHWVFAGFLFSCVALLSCAFWFGFLVSPPVRTGCTPLHHPERTRFRLFLAFPGAFRCFCPLLTCKIFGSVFVHPAA